MGHCSCVLRGVHPSGCLNEAMAAPGKRAMSVASSRPFASRRHSLPTFSPPGSFAVALSGARRFLNRGEEHMMKTRFALARPLRSLLAAALLPTTLTIAPLAIAGDKVVLLTSWYAQAEQGGFYQALADGLYEKEGLDVSIRMGGPQVNGMQLLVSKQADFIVNYDLQILKSVEQGLPVVAVAAPFQGDPQGLMTHADVSGLDGLGGKPVLVSTSGQQTWWPWLKGKYQLADNQARPYTFNLQPFLADPQTTQQAYASSELFQAIKAGVTPNASQLS